jgi:hypothetical protein
MDFTEFKQFGVRFNTLFGLMKLFILALPHDTEVGEKEYFFERVIMA